VALIHKYDRLMNREDRDAAEIIRQTFVREGINLVLGAKPLAVERRSGGKVIR